MPTKRDYYDILGVLKFGSAPEDLDKNKKGVILNFVKLTAFLPFGMTAVFFDEKEIFCFH